MDARFSEEQELLRSQARELLGRECPMARVREAAAAPGAGSALWKELGALGWPGLAVPEAHGGAGLGLVELTVLLEEAGRALLPGPLLSVAALAAPALALGGSEAQRERWLPQLADGSARAALAWLEPGTGWDVSELRLAARRAGGGFRLAGTKSFVVDGADADLLLVPARTGPAPHELTLFAVEASASGLSRRTLDTIDPTRPQAELRFEDVAVGEDEVVGGLDGAPPLLARVLDRGRVALAAECCGGAARVLELSVAYAKTREQFGSPIGRFQAIQHRCADMLVRVESARSATWYAAWAVEHAAPDAHLAACLAKAYACEAYLEVAGHGIQIHGGQGFTWDQDLHLFFKRARSGTLWLGDPAFCRELAARVAIDGAAAP